MNHCGEGKSLANARQLYYWDGMAKDIKNDISKCGECLLLKPSKPMESLVQSQASRPFEAVSVDLGMLKGVNYLVLVDRFTGWPMVKRLTKLDTTAITKILEEWFYDMGKPIRIRSDGGPQFRSGFKDWCKSQDIVHELTSPYNHQANGMAEVTVREMKRLLEKTGQNWPKFQLTLREYRNTPRFDGMSLAQWLFGHRQRTNAMAIPKAYAHVTDEKFKKHLEQRGCEQSRITERVNSPKSKPEQFHPGAKVWIQDPKSNICYTRP